MDDRERLVKIESNTEYLKQSLDKFIAIQEKKNEDFDSTRMDVVVMKATISGMWKIVSVIGIIATAVSSGVAWVISYVNKT